MALKNMRCVMFMRPNMSHGDVLLCANHICRFVCSSICPGALNAVGGVTETPSMYGAIVDATGCMSIEIDVPAGVCTDDTGDMSSPAPVLDIFSPPTVPLTSAAANRRQYLR
jgi:hypothetical protein